MLLSSATALCSFGQGPGGISTTDLELWLTPASIVQTGNGTDVTGWNDISGKGNHLDGYLQNTLFLGGYPTYMENQLNGYGVVDFDGIDDGLYSPLNSVIADNDDWTVFVVFQVDLPNQVNNHGNLWGSFGENANFAILKSQGGQSNVFSVDGLGSSTGQVSLNGERYSTTTGENLASPTRWADGEFAIGSVDYSTINNGITHHGVGSIMDTDNSSLFISGGNDYWFSGQIAEIIVYSRSLSNSKEYLRVTNYLGEKYGIDLNPNTDNTDYDASYSGEMLYLGYETVEFSSNVGDGDGIYVNTTGSFGAGDDLFVSNNNISHDITNDDVTGNYSRWSKVYKVNRVDATSGITEFDISFGTQDAGFGDNNADGNTVNDYRLLYRAGTSGDFTDLGLTPVLDGDLNKVTFTVPDASLAAGDGYFTLGVPAGKTWYSYLVNGNWSDPDMWTLDPSGTLYENDAAEIPATNDRVVILNGKTVFDDLGSRELLSLTVENGGIVDFNTQTGTNMALIKGEGTIRLNEDNFPTANDASDFNSKGKVEFYGSADYAITTTYSFHDVDINMDAGMTVKFGADLTLSGDLVVESGEMQLGADSPLNRAFDFNGNVTIQSGGKLDVSQTYNGTNRVMKIYLAGDFTNQGTAVFSDAGGYDPTGALVDVQADVRFDNANADQRVFLDGPTEFYRIVSDKGADDTYLLDIEASATANFSLIGRNNYTTDNDGEQAHALGLKSGTVKLSSNVVISEVMTGATGNYDIPTACRLWINNAEFNQTGGSALVPYGTVLVSGPLAKMNIYSGLGITLREFGVVEVQDGTVNINQLRRTVQGGVHFGGYKQSGGYVTVADFELHTGSNNGPKSVNAVFDLNENSHIFEMTGGTLHIIKDNQGVSDGTIGAIFVASDEEYDFVTGGTIIIESKTTNDVNITTKTNFPGLTLRNSSGGNTNFVLKSQDSEYGDVITNPELVTIGDFNIEDNITFNNGGFDVETQSNMTVASTSTYSYNTSSTFKVAGSGNRTLKFDNVTTGNPQNFYRFEVNVLNETDTVTLAGSNVDTTQNNNLNRDNDLIQINKALYHREGVFLQANFSVVLKCDSILNTGVTFGDRQTGNPASDPFSNNDRIRFMDHDNAGTAIYVFQSQNARWGTVDIDTDSDYLDLANDFRRFDRFYFKSGRVNMNQHRVQIGSIIEAFDGTRASAGTWSSEDMFVAGGNASDLGIGLSWGNNTNQTRVYPVGIGLTAPNARYTPITFDVTTAGNRNRTHYVTLVDEILQTTVITGGDILSMYWKVDYGWDGTETLPVVDITINYDDIDLDGANDATFTGGKVLEVLPFTRTDPGSVNQGSNIITYTSDDVEFDASYTAGKNPRFVGQPDVYYSYGPGNATTLWSDPNSWSNEGHYTSAVPASDYPDNGAIVIIAFNPTTDAAGSNGVHRIDMDVEANVSTVFFEHQTVKDELGNDYTESNSSNSRLTILNNITTAELGFVDGRGEIVLEVNCTTCSTDPDVTVLQLPIIDGDFGSFAGGGNSDWNIFEYNLIMPANTVGRLPSTVPSIYPRLDINGNDVPGQAIIFTEDLDIRSRLRFYDDGSMWLNEGANGDLTVERGIRFFGGNDESYLKFQDKGTARTVICREIFTMQSPNHRMFVDSTDLAGLEHRFIYGQTERNDRYMDLDDGYIDFYVNHPNASSVVFDIQNYDSTIIYGKETTISDFNRIEVNTLDTTSITITTDFNLSGESNGTTESKSLVHNSGRLVLNNAGINIDISTGGEEFKIPANGTIELQAGQLNISGNSGMRLDGSLIISGGTVDMASDGTTNSIQYTVGTGSSLEMSSGNLLVGGHFMRQLDDDQAAINYGQTGGVARFGVNGSVTDQRGVFETVGASSTYSRTGGSFSVESGNNSTTIGGLHIDRPGTFAEGGTSVILIDAGGTQVGVFTTEKLNHLQIVDAQAQLIVNNLSANQITVDAGSNLDGNDLNVEVSEDWTNNEGVNGFTAGGTNAVFTTSGTTVQMTGNTVFNNFTNSSTSALNLTASNTELTAVDVRNETTINLDDNDFIISGDLVNSGSILATTGYVIMRGSTFQEITSENGSSSTDSYFTNIDIDNSAGVGVVNYLGKPHNIHVYSSLKLTTGIMDVDENYVFIYEDCTIDGSGFGSNKMIKTAGLGPSRGIYLRISGSSTKNLFIPVGSANFYSPVTVDITNSSTSFAALYVRPVEAQHSTTRAGVYSQDLLDFYWRVRYLRNGPSVSGSFTFEYDQSLVNGDENEYGSAKFISSNWILSVNDVDIVNNQFVSTFTNPVNQSIIDYTCGDTKATSPVTFPVTIPEYISITTGDWNDANTWLKDGLTNEVPQEGSRVTVSTNDEVTVNADGVSIYNLTIDGKLSIGNTIKHNLGVVDGQGIIGLVSGQFPGGSYDDFLTTTGGVVEFGGTGTYTTSAQVIAVRGLIFSGTGTRVMPFLTETVGDSILIDGVSVDNTVNNANFDLEGDIAVRNGGTFMSGTGGVNFVGDKDGRIKTPLTGDNSLGFMTVNKGTGDVYIDGDSVVVKNSIGFENGKIITNGNVFYMLKDVTYTTAPSNNSFVQGRACKEMINAGTFEFPVGDDILYAPSSVNSSSAGDWCAAFYYENPTTDGYDVSQIKTESPQIVNVSNNAYWDIEGPTSATAFGGVSLTWPFATEPYENVADAVVAEWDAANGYWYSKGGSYDAASKVLTSGGNVTFSLKQFTFASIGTPLPVDFIYFKGKTVQEGVLLEWATASELNNEKFIIERSVDLTNFTQIGTVLGSGDSNIEISYEFLDENAPNGTVYYRLKQVDFDGGFEYSKIVAVLIEARGAEINDVVDLLIYPNPSRSGEVITFEFFNHDGEDITVQLMNLNGTLILEETSELGEGELYVLEEDLPVGLYIVRAVIGDQTIIRRIVIQ